MFACKIHGSLCRGVNDAEIKFYNIFSEINSTGWGQYYTHFTASCKIQPQHSMLCLTVAFISQYLVLARMFAYFATAISYDHKMLRTFAIVRGVKSCGQCYTTFFINIDRTDKSLLHPGIFSLVLYLWVSQHLSILATPVANVVKLLTAGSYTFP